MKKSLMITFSAMLIVFAIGGYFVLNRTGKISSKADATGASLVLDPNIGSYYVGSDFDVNIKVDTSGSAIYGVQVLGLHFDPKKMQVVDADPGTPDIQISKGNISAFNTVIQNVADNKEGTVKYSESKLPGKATYNGSDIVAKIKFKAIATATDTSVTFDFDSSTTKTSLADEVGDNLLQVVGSAAFNIVATKSESTNGDTGDNSIVSGNSKKSSVNSKMSADASAVVAPPAVPELQYSKVQLYKNDSMKPWTLWFLYAIIPSFLTGGAIYFYLKRRRLQKNDEII